MAIGDLERKTQNRVIKLFKDTLNYRYIGNWEDEERTRLVGICNLFYPSSGGDLCF
jgi:hypothetical protein